nr:hypothetical protein [Tanacetum cinerariifolium]
LKSSTNMENHPHEAINTVLNCVIPYIQNGDDRNSVSLVCHKLCELEDWFPEKKLSIDINQWIQEIAVSFRHLKSLHIRHMDVHDSDLELLARTRGRELRVLKISKCKGFSTDGLLHIGKYCNDLRTLCLKGNQFNNKDGNWLHELALQNTGIESLDFRYFNIHDVKDLTLLANNCCRICDLTESSFPFVLPFAHQLRELHLIDVYLDDNSQCLLIKSCPNLEVLYTTTVFGDMGLQVIGRSCKKLLKFKTYGCLFEYIGKYGHNLRYLSLGHLGESAAAGLVCLSKGCPKLRKLEIRSCPFSKQTLAPFVCDIHMLRYVSVRDVNTDMILAMTSKFSTLKHQEYMLVMQLKRESHGYC